MKNISLFLNAILLVAVGILYYLHFKNPQDNSPAQSSPVILAQGSGAMSSIVYINTDSLLDNYSFYKTKKAEFEAKSEKVKNDLEAEGVRLQNDYESYQQKGAMMTDAERQNAEEQLMMRQQNLMKKKDDMVEKLDNEQAKFSEDLHAKLVAHAKEFNKGKNYSFILAYQKGGGILLANDSLDITKQLLEGLNKTDK